MRAVVCNAIGSPEALVVEEIAEPVAAAGEVLVAVEAASINFPDLLVVQGLYQFTAEPPFVPGAEGAGIVAAIGEGVTEVAVGDEVLFSGVVGAFADKVAVPVTATMAKPPSMPWEEAASFRFTFGTSYYALAERGRLAPGETLLVLGAAGGVGSAAVQLGEAMGATVIAAASTDEKLDFARSVGADEVVNYSTEDLRGRVKELTGGAGVDVVYDPVGGEHTEAALRVTAWGGRLLVVGFAAGSIPRIPLNLPLLKGCEVVGVFWGSWLQRAPQAARRSEAELIAMYEAGKIAPRVMQVFPLEACRDAFETMLGRRVMGKVVLRIGR